MTPQIWLALALAVVLLAGPGTASARLGALAGTGRLIAAAREPAASGTRWVPVRALAGGALGAVIAIVGVTGGLLLATAAAAIGAVGWLLAGDAVRRAGVMHRRAQLLAAVRVLVGELAAGARPPAALTAAAETSPSYAAVFGAAAMAATRAGDAGAVLADYPDTRTVGLAWRLGEDTGSELSGVLTRVSLELAAVDEQRRNVEIALAGPRASAALLAGLPMLGIALGAAMGAQPWSFLFGAPAGRAVCCVGVLLDVAGLLWMRRILRRAQRS